MRSAHAATKPSSPRSSACRIDDDRKGGASATYVQHRVRGLARAARHRPYRPVPTALPGPRSPRSETSARSTSSCVRARSARSGAATSRPRCSTKPSTCQRRQRGIARYVSVQERAQHCCGGWPGEAAACSMPCAAARPRVHPVLPAGERECCTGKCTRARRAGTRGHAARGPARRIASEQALSDTVTSNRVRGARAVRRRRSRALVARARVRAG